MSIFNPENFTAGTGLLDDVDVEFKEVRVSMFDYNGKALNGPVPALQVTMEVEGGEDHVQYYSMGKASDWQPSDDGCSVVAVGKATAIANNSNAAILISSLVNAGFPVNKIDDDVRCFEGLKAHMTRVPAPKRGTQPKAPREDGRVFDDTILTVGTIIALPGEKGKATPKGKPNTGTAPAATKPTTPAPAAEDLDEVCSGLLIEILSEAGAPMAKSKIPPLALAKAKERKDKSKVVSRIFAEAFLKTGAENGMWVYEGGQVSLAE